MGFILYSMVIGAISLILYLLFPTNYSEWFIWIVYMIISIFFLIKSFTEHNSFEKGEEKNIGDIMGMASFPFTTSVMIIILIIFLFINTSKFHLLWIYVLIAIIFDLTIGMRAGKIVRENIDSEEEIGVSTKFKIENKSGKY